MLVPEGGAANVEGAGVGTGVIKDLVFSCDLFSLPTNHLS